MDAYHSAGTFLFNNDFERYHQKLFDKTTSLWTHLNSAMEIRQFLNPIFDLIPGKLAVSANPANIAIWKELYCRWTSNRVSDDEVTEILMFYADRDEAMSRESEQLLSTISAVDNQLQHERRELLATVRAFLANPGNFTPNFDPFSVDDLDPLKSTSPQKSLKELTTELASLTASEEPVAASPSIRQTLRPSISRDDTLMINDIAGLVPSTIVSPSSFSDLEALQSQSSLGGAEGANADIDLLTSEATDTPEPVDVLFSQPAPLTASAPAFSVEQDDAADDD